MVRQSSSVFDFTTSKLQKNFRCSRFVPALRCSTIIRGSTLKRELLRLDQVVFYKKKRTKWVLLKTTLAMSKKLGFQWGNRQIPRGSKVSAKRCVVATQTSKRERSVSQKKSQKKNFVKIRQTLFEKTQKNAFFFSLIFTFSKILLKATLSDFDEFWFCE